MMQLLLAVINQNLLKVITQDAFDDLQEQSRLVEIDKETKPDNIDPSGAVDSATGAPKQLTPMQEMALALKAAKLAKAKEEEEAKKKEEESKKQTPMQEMALAIKAARAAKLEEQRKAEIEAKHKEEMQTQPMTSMKAMAEAIKKAKAEKAAKEARDK